MNNYTEDSRGKYQCPEYARQIILFDGFLLEGSTGITNVSPTDIDGYIQLDVGNIFIFFELKYAGDIPTGQKRALEKLCDAVNAGGGHAIVFHAIHGQETGEIMARDAIVANVYYCGKWKPYPKKCDLLTATKNYINFIRKNIGEDNHYAET